ncbi:hypothetical protein ACFVUH_02510 [Kitasatospora sp. NPDC058032]|uniref:hypothetical protein n=1 Tax=Kitasatospora sp. NPDC058032 TaxID=3346307 RepID=UPI0036DBE619
MKKPGILATMALALAATLGPVAGAQAAPAENGPAGAGASITADVTTSAVASGTARTSAEGCPVALEWGAPTVITLCGTTVRGWTWPDGRHEHAAVGSDRQVWHTFQTSPNGPWSPWTVFGSASNVLDGVGTAYVNGVRAVSVLGSDGLYWCNSLDVNGSGVWTDWHHC